MPVKISSAVTTFLDSPANRQGLATWVGTVIVAGGYWLVTKHLPVDVSVFGLVVGGLKIISPDNSVTVTQLEKATQDITTLVDIKSAASVGNVIADAEAIAGAIKK